MIEVLDIGDRVGTGRYRLHSRFRGAIAFIGHRSGRLVSVVDETKSAGPVNIVVRGLDFDRTGTLAVDSRMIYLDSTAVPFRRRSDSCLGPLHFEPARLCRNLVTLRETLMASAPTRAIVFLLNDGPDAARESSAFESQLTQRLHAGAEQLLAGDLAGAAAMRGLGHGLTPSGDDFLAGYLLGLYAFEKAGCTRFARRRQAIGAIAVSRNPFSAALLSCAAEGRSIEPARSLIRALFEDSEAGVVRETRRLAAVGASSGADLATGLYFALKANPEEAET
jgi:Protein of unknown function (DUF2877)